MDNCESQQSERADVPPSLLLATTGSGARLVTPAPALRNPLYHGRTANSSSGARRRTTPGTGSTDVLSKSVVVAIAEGRGLARGDIGMASFDLKNPELVLAQFPDNRMYTNTLMKLQVLDPHEILLPKTVLEGNLMPQLVSQLKQEMPTATITSLARKFFNENLGIQYVRKLCVPEYSSVETEVVNKYYALSATAALIHYVEMMQNVACTAHSIKVIFSSGEGVARIGEFVASSSTGAVFITRGVNREALVHHAFDNEGPADKRWREGQPCLQRSTGRLA
ncbi:hypothetical protein V5799_007423 [Amblyomma americanum]|uniref:DNA mismatch repair protein MutS connector domain-containing protein n=1 Tax=Amblyomma americanum TaxID=6943 RepID=A0AAQ4FGF9_AMBAM